MTNCQLSLTLKTGSKGRPSKVVKSRIVVDYDVEICNTTFSCSNVDVINYTSGEMQIDFSSVALQMAFYTASSDYILSEWRFAEFHNSWAFFYSYLAGIKSVSARPSIRDTMTIGYHSRSSCFAKRQL